MTSKKELISVRVTSEEKRHIKQLATKNNQSMTDYVRHTLLSDNVKQSSNERNTSNHEQLNVLINQLEVKDTELTEKNKQIAHLHNLLDQQQRLTLSSNALATDLKKQLDTKQQSHTSKWYQFWRN